MLNLDFTEEQDMLRDMVRGVCAQLAPFEVVRALEDDPDGIARELWAQFGELGVNGLMIPEEYGGSGMALLEGVMKLQEKIQEDKVLRRRPATLGSLEGAQIAAEALK